MKEETSLSEKIETSVSALDIHQFGVLDVVNVKEKVQNAQRRLKEEIGDCLFGVNFKDDESKEIIDKIFKEEFGEKLTDEN